MINRIITAFIIMLGFQIPCYSITVGINLSRPVYYLKQRAFINPNYVGKSLYKRSNIRSKKLAKLWKASQAIALVQFIEIKNGKQKTYNGTGFMISKDLMLTNYHNIGAWRKIKSAYAIFGYHHVNSKTEKFKIISVKIGDKQYDYALAKLAPKKINRQKIYPGNKYGILKLGLYLPKIEEQLYLVGHPKGKPKAYSETACEMIKYSKFAMIHTCDTKPGSSGSPILNRFMEVVGLHASGINIRSSLYQRSNKAYRIDYIWQLFGGYAAAAEKYMYNTPGTTYRKNIFVNSLNNQYFKWVYTKIASRRNPVNGLALPKNIFFMKAQCLCYILLNFQVKHGGYILSPIGTLLRSAIQITHIVLI